MSEFIIILVVPWDTQIISVNMMCSIIYWLFIIIVFYKIIQKPQRNTWFKDIKDISECSFVSIDQRDTKMLCNQQWTRQMKTEAVTRPCYPLILKSVHGTDLNFSYSTFCTCVSTSGDVSPCAWLICGKIVWKLRERLHALQRRLLTSALWCMYNRPTLWWEIKSNRNTVESRNSRVLNLFTCVWVCPSP